MVRAGWHSGLQTYGQFSLRAGRVIVWRLKSRRDKGSVLHADYVLLHKPNIPLAVVEGKKSRLSRLAGVQQAIQYALLLGVPFIFTSNGFVFRDEALASGVLEQNITLDQSSPAPKNSGSATAPGKARRPLCKAQRRSITRPTRPRTTTKSTPSTALCRPLLLDKNACYSSWLPTPEKPSPLSRSSTA